MTSSQYTDPLEHVIRTADPAPALRQLASADQDDEVTLPGQRTRIALSSGESFVVRVTNRDYLAWDKTAPRKRWGSAQEVPFLFATFIAWNAARREGLTSLTFDGWSDAVEDVTPLTQDETDVARPTRRGREDD